MIKNRLAELISERSLKITQVAKDTGISRNTITATAQNDSKMIQLETVNTLCKYLGVTPCEFFTYVPFDFKVNLQTDSLHIDYNLTETSSKVTSIKHSFDLFIDVEYRTKIEKFKLTGKVDYLYPSSAIDIKIDFETEESEKKFNGIKESLPAGLIVQLVEQLEFEIEYCFNAEITEYLELEASKNNSMLDCTKILKLIVFDLEKKFISDSYIFVPF